MAADGTGRGGVGTSLQDWSGQRESNPHEQLGKLPGYHYIMPAEAARQSYRRAARLSPATRGVAGVRGPWEAASMPSSPPRALEAVRRAWKALPIPYPLRRALMSRVYRGLEWLHLLRTRPRLAWRRVGRVSARPSPRILYRPDVRTLEPGDVLLSGFLTAHMGIGRSGRMGAQALQLGGVPLRLHDLDLDRPGHTLSDVGVGGVWFAFCNPPEAVHFMTHASHPAVFERRYRIGFWAWELAELPPDWIEAVPLFHEVWAGSPFVADAVRKAAEGTDVKVRMIPYPLPEMAAARADRERFGWRPGELAVLCMFDVNSTAARKNPMGAVEAFQRAFAPGDATVRLIVKANAKGGDPALVPAALRERVAGWPNITLLIAELSDADADNLLASADVFVSLHRSEGFGLSIAQSMVLGRAVIATGWSGNADFQAGGVIEVPYTLTRASDPSGRYAIAGQVWAEPDIDFAANALRRFAEDRDSVRIWGERGREVVGTRLPRIYPPADFAPWLSAA